MKINQFESQLESLIFIQNQETFTCLKEYKSVFYHNILENLYGISLKG